MTRNKQASVLSRNVLHAIVGSAFACYRTSGSGTRGVGEHGTDDSELIDLMYALRPQILGSKTDVPGQ